MWFIFSGTFIIRDYQQQRQRPFAMGSSQSTEEVVIAQSAIGNTQATSSQLNLAEILLIALFVLIFGVALFFLCKRCRESAIRTLRREMARNTLELQQNPSPVA
jgi:hypothetical protein